MAGSFDLRRKDDREALGTAMQKLNTEHWIADGARNANSALLQCYSDGYGLLEGIIGPEPVTKTYHGEAFHRHREFVADDARSVYLQDILLEIETDNISENVEVADCQGSDSPNPLHLAMIQDYLLTTHLCIYVISSRTGVRQADIKFLSIIKKMGIADNLVFVVNCDFSEHDVIGDLEKLIDKIKAELSLLISDPDPYTFSSLYNLFKTQGEQISQKDALRMEQWQSETELVALSDAETERFRKKFNHKLTHERSILFLANHLERLSIVANGVSTWLETGRGLLSDDVVSARQTVEQIRQRQGKIDQILP